MQVLRYVLMSLFLIVGIGLVAVVLLQEAKSAGLGTLGGMADSYWQRNKSRSIEGLLQKLSKILAIAFFVLAFVLTINF
ncbi:MAG: preprotein translocase subunit SecG [Lachnospiraceae bacterium]|nr:preprotein translocase subunit SecG [Lachnospiraceae bacterium]